MLALLALALGLVPEKPAAAQSLMPPKVATLLRASGLPLTSFGIAVRAVDDDQPGPWVAVNAEQPFLLASTAKLVTSLAALDLLGQQQRWATDAYGTGPVADGRLAGDLVIVGGSVGLTTAELGRWFKQMHRQGVREVAGNIVLQNVSLLHENDPAQAPATARELMPDATPDARVYNEGKLLVSVQPGTGERATVVVRPRPANVLVVNEVTMGGGSCNAWASWRDARDTAGGPPLQLWVRGRWDVSCGREDIAFMRPPGPVRWAPELGAAAPTAVSAPNLIATLWTQAGGRLRGAVIEGAAGKRPRVAAGRRWSSQVSTPIGEVLREMNKTSNNVAARSLLLSLGSPAASSAATLHSARARVQGWLQAQGLSSGDIQIDIGSGQSRAERGRPRALVHLLQNAWRHAGSQTFVDSLPIAGVDGTLLHRMRSGPAHAQAFLKTGTLSDTRALAGYVRGKSGKVYAVAAIVTHPDAARGTPTLDALMQWLAAAG